MTESIGLQRGQFFPVSDSPDISSVLVRDSEGVTPGYFYCCALLMGFVSGIIGVAFHSLLDASLAFHDALKSWLEWQAIELLAFACGSALLTFLAAWIVRRFAPEAAGSGVQEIEGTLEDKRPLRWARILPVKFVGGALAISSGLVLGREGPTIHMGASAGLGIASYAGLPRIEQKALIAAGAAAGLAAAFNAPVAAVLFIIEETRTQFPWTLRTYNGVIIASALSGVITEMVGGVGPDLTISALQAPLLEHVPLFAILGIFLGGIGVLFNWALIRTLDAVAVMNSKCPLLFAAVFGALVGVLLILFPDATGGGDALIPRLVTDNPGIWFLLLLLLLRGASTLASYATGAPGGIFAPMLALATVLGLAFAALVAELVPAVQVQGPAFAIAAMGGLFAATVRAPLVAVVLVAELTGAYGLMLPVLITCGMANLTAHQLNGEPIYELLLARTLRLAHSPSNKQDDRVPLRLGVGK